MIDWEKAVSVFSSISVAPRLALCYTNGTLLPIVGKLQENLGKTLVSL
jgi:hypothetical protein